MNGYLRRLPLALVLATGCGFITAEEAAKEFLPVFCDKVKECNPSGFASAFPGGQQDCIDKGMATIPADKRGARDACSSSQIDTCVADTKAMTCPTTGTITLAKSCEGC